MATPSDSGVAMRNLDAVINQIFRSRFTGAAIYAVDLIVRHVAVDPLDVGAKILEDMAGLLGRLLKVAGTQVADTRHFPLDYELWHIRLSERLKFGEPKSLNLSQSTGYCS
ncbi:hypothetical protein SPHV1_2170032 [Novosphingobium sp. KN65.2]|nr:hypothetical protein SPHV1_2170032 [Novosphingobium sp. KN65.2]